MGVMKVVLPDKLEEKFREEIFERKGMKKGNLSESAAEAIEMWLKKSRKEKEEKKTKEKETEEKEAEEETEEETSEDEESWSL